MIFFTFDKESIDNYNITTTTRLLGTVCPTTASPEVVISNETKEFSKYRAYI